MSKQVKIILSKEVLTSYDDPYNYTLIRDGITDWEEISDEDYDFLRWNLSYLCKTYNEEYGNLVPMIIVKDDKPVLDRIESIKDFIEQLKTKEAERKAEEERKKAEKAKKRMMKKVADERALFEQLKEKFDTK